MTNLPVDAVQKPYSTAAVNDFEKFEYSTAPGPSPKGLGQLGTRPPTPPTAWASCASSPHLGQLVLPGFINFLGQFVFTSISYGVTAMLYCCSKPNVAGDRHSLS